MGAHQEHTWNTILAFLWLALEILCESPFKNQQHFTTQKIKMVFGASKNYSSLSKTAKGRHVDLHTHPRHHVSEN